jgi:hypothetical protein
MKRLLYSLFCVCALLLGSVTVYADEDCDQSLREARQAYNAGNYKRAKDLCNYVVSVCGANYGDVSSLLSDIEEQIGPRLTVSRTNVSVGSSAGSTSITVTCNRAWELANTNSTLFTVSRSGNTVTIRYSDNRLSEERKDYFDVKTTDGSKSVRVRVTQSPAPAAPTLSVSPASIDAPASGTTRYLTVSSNTSWEIEYPSGQMYSVTRNGNTLTVVINENTSSSARSDYFNVKTTDGSRSLRVNMSQEASAYSVGANISVSRTEISVGPSATTEYLTVSCNTSWEVEYPTATMYSVTRNGNSLTVHINENTSSDSRTDFFNVKASDGTKVRINLRQEGRTTLSVSRTELNVGSYATTEYLTVNSSISWEVEYPTATMYSVTRNGNSLTVRINENTSADSRTDFFNVKGSDGTKIRINIRQEGRPGGTSISVSRTELNVGSSATTEYLTVSSNASWEVEYPTATMYSVTRNGNSLTVHINENTSTDSRSDFFNVKATDGTKVRINIHQEGRASSGYINVSRTELNVGYSATTEYLTVSSSISWEVEYPTATMYTVTRNGNSLTVQINANTSADSRSDFFNVKGSDGTKVRINLHQSGRPGGTSISVSRTELNVGPSATTEYLTVSSNASWEVEYPTATMYSVTRNGNSLTVYINENTTGDSRTDFFNVKATDGTKVRINIRQEAYSGNIPAAEIKEIWVDHNVYENSVKGMRIHFKMDVDNLRNKSCRAIVYFYDEDGNALIDQNGNYNTTNGKVAVGESFTPSYESSTFSDFKIFMPYNELHITRQGSYKFSISIWNQSVTPNVEMTTSEWKYFTFTP